jgi:hypothetical protein
MDRRRFLLTSLGATLAAPVGAEVHTDGCAAAREKKPERQQVS